MRKSLPFLLIFLFSSPFFLYLFSFLSLSSITWISHESKHWALCQRPCHVIRNVTRGFANSNQKDITYHGSGRLTDSPLLALCNLSTLNCLLKALEYYYWCIFTLQCYILTIKTWGCDRWIWTADKRWICPLRPMMEDLRDWRKKLVNSYTGKCKADSGCTISVRW